MNITKCQLYDQITLVSKLRAVTLENSSVVTIYRNAEIQLVEINLNDLYPAQLYVLESELAKITAIRSAFLRKGIDILALNGYIKFWTDTDRNMPVDILPPMVEESLKSDGNKVFLICDGLHRLYLARKLGIKVKVVLIQNIPEEFPYYAYPNENKWDDVIEIDELPQGFVKKRYRVENHRKLFRDFNSAFDNVGRRRKSVK